MNKLPNLPTCAREGEYPDKAPPLPFPFSLFTFIFGTISTFVERTLQISYFYAKQTQFEKGRNVRKVFSYSGL
jgi:hypothetical protein